MFGQLGHGKSRSNSQEIIKETIPKKVSFDHKVKLVLAGLDHSFIVTGN